MIVRAKADELTEKDRELYTSVSADNSISSSKYGGKHVGVKLSLQRRIWTSGSTIFCALHINNETDILVRVLEKYQFIIIGKINTGQYL